MHSEVIMCDALLTAKQVARTLNIRPATVYAAAAAGRIPYVRLWKGRRRALIRFRRIDIDQLVRERLYPSPQDDSGR